MNRPEILDFDLRSTLEDMGDPQAVCAAKKGLKYHCLIESDVPSLLKGDPGRVRQRLNNLIGNAIKFTSEGEVILQVDVQSETDSDVTVCFSVTDTGIGIPQDRPDELFNPFTQADSSTTRKFGGTGLGLSIAKELSKMMGGHIGVESNEGKGARFWFTAVFQKQLLTEDLDISSSADVRDLHVLVVDDNAIDRRVLRLLLNSWECRPDEAPDGNSAIEKLQEAADNGDPFRVALVDMQFLETDGESLGKKIKEIENLKDTLLVMITSIGRRGDVRRLKKIGFSAYLTKPVKKSELYNCLMMVLNRDAYVCDTRKNSLITRHTIADTKKRKTRILLAEDNVINQKVALKILEKLGYRADAVANGQEAVTALQSVPYELVLMDVQMPGMDGFEATHTIRSKTSEVRNPSIPIIAMTAHAMTGDREKCIEAGMDDYVTKPVEPEKLARVIEKWIHKQHLGENSF